MRFLYLLFSFALISACSLFPTYDQEQIEDETPRDHELYTYATGEGKTRDSAAQDARLMLAQQISTQVTSAFEQIINASKNNADQASTFTMEEEYQKQVKNFTHLQLSGVEVVDIKRVKRRNYQATVRITHENMQSALLLSQKQAPALAYATLISAEENLTQSERLRIAALGLNKALEYEVQDSVLNMAGVQSHTTFGSYFTSQIDRAKKSLSLLPMLDGNRVSFVLIDKASKEPQPGFIISVEGKTLLTNDAGFTAQLSLKNLPQQFTPLLLGALEVENSYIDEHLLSYNSFNQKNLKNFDTTVITVHTVPAGSTVMLKNGNTVLQSASSPAQFVVGSYYEHLQLEMFNKRETFHVHNIHIGKPKSSHHYYSVSLGEKQFGRLNLTKQDSRASFIIKNKNREIVFSGTDNINQDIEVGTYKLVLQHKDANNYQIIDDSLYVVEGESINRRYKKLLYRKPYKEGRFSDLILGIGLDLGSEYELPLKDGSKQEHRLFKDDFADKTGNYLIGLRRMWLNDKYFAFSLGAETTTHYYKDTLENTANLWSVGAHAGVGFWSRGLFDKAVVWVTANYNHSYNFWTYRFDKDLGKEEPKFDSFDRGYPFLDIGMRGEMFGLGLRISDPDQASPMLYLSVGNTTTQKGYRIDNQHVQAQEGKHF